MLATHWNRLLMLPLFFMLTACPPPNERVDTAASEPVETAETPVMPDDPDPALWVIRDEDTTIYLFGTVHILKPGMTWFDEAVRNAFFAADELVVEMLKPDPADMMKVVSELAIDKTGKSLRDKLDAEQRLEYEAALAGLDLPPASFDPLDPWFAAVTISVTALAKNGYDANQGVEDALFAEASARSMKTIGLETLRQQLGFFDNLPEEVQIRFLNFTIDTIDETAEGMEAMVAHWANGNTQGLAEMMNAGLDDPILFDTLLAERNAEWAKWVDARMDEPGTLFMAVGAGHLAGRSSLQELLEAKGHLAQRIEY